MEKHVLKLSLANGGVSPGFSATEIRLTCPTVETQPSELCGRVANKISAVAAVQVLRPLPLIQLIQRQCFYFSLMLNFCSGFSDNCVQEQLITKRG